MSEVRGKVFVGLDYHQHTVQVCVLDGAGQQIVNATRPNDWEAIVECVPEGVKVFAAMGPPSHSTHLCIVSP